MASTISCTLTPRRPRTGKARIQLTFAPGTNADTAQVQVQNRVQLAVPRLPLTVQQQGIRVVKSSGNFLLIVGFVSTDGRMERTDISDFLVANVQDPISRTAGVGDFQVFGAQFAMRIWLDPAKLVNFGLTPADVATAVRAQNVQVSSGEMGALPAVPGQQLNATIIGPSYLQTVDEFGAILMRVRADGSQVRLRDVARIEIGGENYSITTLLDGRPSSGIGSASPAAPMHSIPPRQCAPPLTGFDPASLRVSRSPISRTRRPSWSGPSAAW